MAHTLLVADDSPTIQRVVELTFAGEDVTVVTASDGDQAIAVLERQEPDLVLVDVSMPGRGGYDVAHYVRATSRLAHIPVLLMIGAFDEVDESRARALGCAGVLVKPFEPQLLADRVKALLVDPTRPFFLETSPARRNIAATVMKDAFAAPPDEPEYAAASGEIDQYFDRLDQAFANLSTSPGAEPRSHVTDATEFAARRSASLDRDESREPTRPLRGPEPVTPPSLTSAAPSPLADAFGALLAAEASAPPPDTPPSWPAAAPIDTDALVEQISARVLERLTDRVVRETAAEIISQVAERLVLEEIERIKSRLR